MRFRVAASQSPYGRIELAVQEVLGKPLTELLPHYHKFPEPPLLNKVANTTFNGSILFLHVATYEFGSDPLNLPKWDLSSMRMLVYTTIHGYHYKRVVYRRPLNGRGAVWVKVDVLSRYLKLYDMVVLLDTDVYLNYLTIPFEALLQHWNFTDSKLVVNVMDPDDGGSKNQVNTGFMVFRNHAVVHAAIDAWWSCPERLANCAKYKDVLWAEQQAYSWFVFPTFAPDQVALANVSEANGFPVSEGNPSRIAIGKLISHWWYAGQAPFEAMLREEMPREVMAYVMILLMDAHVDVAYPDLAPPAA